MAEPEGLWLLQGPKQSEGYTVAKLNECEEKHRIREDDYGCNNCESQQQCQELYELRSTGDTRWGGWGFYFMRIKLRPRQIETEEQRYANTLPQISRRAILSEVRARYLG